MPKILSEKQIAEYEENGLVFPVTVMSENDAKLLTRKLETYEAESGGPIQKEWRHKVHLLFTWANEIVRHPKILDAVEDLIGPNIICWTTNFFIKEDFFGIALTPFLLGCSALSLCCATSLVFCTS